MGPVGSTAALPGDASATETVSPTSSPAPASTSTRNPFAAPVGDDEFVTTPQAAPQRFVPGSSLDDDEISTTPQARPERVPPGAESSESSSPPE